MATQKVALEDLPSAIRNLVTRSREKAITAIRRSVRLYAPFFIAQAVDTLRPPPVDTGAFKRNWFYQDIDRGIRVYNPLPYASVIEHGRRAGARQPPSNVLVEWVKRKGLVAGVTGNREAAARGLAFVIARKIGREGLKPRPVLGTAMKKLRPLLLREIKNEFAKP